MIKRITIFTDADLDGAGCVLVAKWCFPDCDISFKVANERTFGDIFTQYLKSDRFQKDDRVYICDLNVIDKHLNLLDNTKIFYIDHHEGTFTRPAGFKGEIIKEPTPSCASLFYQLIGEKESGVVLTKYQKLLLALIDDYDAYDLKYPASLNLNTVFYSLQWDRIQNFCDKFKDGFKGFNEHQNNVIRFHNLKVNQIFDSLSIYQSVVSLEGVRYKIVSTFADYAINEVASHILKKAAADLCFVINQKTNTVSFRKTRGIEYDISKLAKTLADGDGNSNAAGGKLTPKMLVFSKVFKPL